MHVGDLLLQLLQAGWLGLLDYLAAHVLLCLVPAFFFAGYLSLIPKETITHYLGPKTPKWISYPASAVGGFVLAVCSCTILPLFAGIWKRGAGLGPAVTFLFVGPAVNILAISYTGAAIGGTLLWHAWCWPSPSASSSAWSWRRSSSSQNISPDQSRCLNKKRG